jgi:Tol biopolymer transport system component
MIAEIRRPLAAAALVLAALAGCDTNVNNGGFLLAVTERASVGPAGEQGTAPSTRARISADGRFVVFESKSSSFGSVIANGTTNIFLRDRVLGTTTRVSFAFDGVGDPDQDCVSPAVSDDGRWVAFQTSARNLLNPDDLNNNPDIYLRDMNAAPGAFILISATTGGLPAGGQNPDLATDAAGGQVQVVFDSPAAAETLDGTLAGGFDTGGDLDVFVRAVGGATTLVSLGQPGGPAVQANAPSSFPSISAVGSNGASGFYVAFVSTAGNLDGAGGPTGVQHVYRRALPAGPSVRISSRTAGNPANGDNFGPAISRDGNFVAFSSVATDLVADDSNGFEDVFVRDVATPATELVSRHDSGLPGTNNSTAPRISGDGAVVAFRSNASNLVDDDANSAADVFVRFRATGSTVLASIRTFGDPTPPLTVSDLPDVSADGRFVVFNSNAGTLVDNDNNGVQDVFSRGPLR